MSTNWKAKAMGARTALMSNGALCSLSWTPKSTDDGPLAVTPDPVSYEAYAAIFDYNWKQLGTQQDSLIQAGDKQLLLSVFTEPARSDLPEPPFGALVVAPDGVTYKVAGVKVVAPAGTRVMYELNLRR